MSFSSRDEDLSAPDEGERRLPHFLLVQSLGDVYAVSGRNVAVEPAVSHPEGAAVALLLHPVFGVKCWIENCQVHRKACDAPEFGNKF